MNSQFKIARSVVTKLFSGFVALTLFFVQNLGLASPNDIVFADNSNTSVRKITREEFGFLFDAMDKKIKSKRGKPILKANEGTVKGDMNIPEPVVVDTKGDMSDEDFKACSMVMAVCKNMIQKSLTDAATKNGIPQTEALKDMDAWVSAFVDFPFPFFNFKDTQSRTYKKEDFSLKADEDVVESIVNIKNVPNLKDAVISAIKKSSGNLANFSQKDEDFKYFGVISGFNKSEASVRLVKFGMHMKSTDVKTLCGGVSKSNLDSYYDTYQFVADAALMIKIKEKIEGQTIEFFAKKLWGFIEKFYEGQVENYQASLDNMFKKKKMQLSNPGNLNWMQPYPAGIAGSIAVANPATANFNFSPDFSAANPPQAGLINQVNITLTGNRGLDFAASNQQARMQQTPNGYTWHHVYMTNYDPNQAPMQLIDSGIHRGTCPHMGSARQWVIANPGQRYRSIFTDCKSTPKKPIAGEKISDDVILGFEKKYNVTIPKDLRKIYSSGLADKKNTISFLSNKDFYKISTLYNINENGKDAVEYGDYNGVMRGFFTQNSLVPMGEDEFGNIYCVNNFNQMVFVNHETLEIEVLNVNLNDIFGLEKDLNCP